MNSARVCIKTRRIATVYGGYLRLKHLLVDEIQDYTPVQYAVLARLFLCNKTILGDARQSVNPYSSTTSEEILRASHASSAQSFGKIPITFHGKFSHNSLHLPHQPYQ